MTPSNTQKCGAPRCQSCAVMCDVGESFTINNKVIKAPSRGYNCKTRNAIYVAQCQLCIGENENGYSGQTTQPTHKRINGHRSCFNIDNEEVAEKSALALHAYEKHQDNFSLNNYKFMIVKNCSPRALNRLESRTIGELRTNVIGLNRMNIQK